MASLHDNHHSMSPVQRLFKLLENFKSEIKEIYLFALLNSLVSLSLPLGLQAIIQYLITGQPSSSLYLIMAVIVLATVLNGWMNIHQLNISEHVRQMLFVRGAFDFVHRIPIWMKQRSREACQTSHAGLQDPHPPNKIEYRQPTMPRLLAKPLCKGCASCPVQTFC